MLCPECGCSQKSLEILSKHLPRTPTVIAYSNQRFMLFPAPLGDYGSILIGETTMRIAVGCILLLTAMALVTLWVAFALSPAPVPTVATLPGAAPPRAAPLPPDSVATIPTPAATSQLTTASPPATTLVLAPSRALAAAPPPACPGNPNALGLARVLEIDTTGGPGFGFEHFKMHDFLRPNEVLLTFDDGPWPNNTQAVLKALANHCIKATFFPIGKHVTFYPEILRQVAAHGHTIGSHTWSHADLSKKSTAEAKDEIEKGISAVHRALGAAAPFFRFPALAHPPELVTYLGERNIGIFSTDLDSFDFRIRKPQQMIQSVMNKLQKNGKGIVLMHDFQQVTATALPELLNQLSAGGYKVVHVTAKDAAQTLPEYDALVAKDQILPTVSDRSTTAVVRTISQ
jgi:peptidoglycan-N-acetylglucosamine deacetylase